MLLLGDCRDSMAFCLGENEVDAIVTDPPYELAFMGKKWDGTGVAFDVETWRQCLRVLKPGGHLLAFGGTRTYHRMVCAIEDAGFEIRDQIGWAYGSGFPKSHNGEWGGTALKPAWEPICMARKPLIGTVAANVLAHGTGGLNIDGCRVDGGVRPLLELDAKQTDNNTYAGRMDGGSLAGGSKAVGDTTLGRWPANLIHDGSDEVVTLFPQSGSASADTRDGEPSADSENKGAIGFKMRPGARRLDAGSAARFFYCAKASRSDRNDGCESMSPEYLAIAQARIAAAAARGPGT